MEISIRSGQVADADALSVFCEQTFRDTYGSQNEPQQIRQYVLEHFSSGRVRSELTDAKCRFLVACEGDGRIVGYAKLIASDPEPCVVGKAIEIQRIYVDAGAKGSGIGGQLMLRCIDEARAAGYSALWLGVWTENAPAVAFYRKWKFDIVGTHIFVLGDDEQTDWVMRRAV